MFPLGLLLSKVGNGISNVRNWWSECVLKHESEVGIAESAQVGCWVKRTTKQNKNTLFLHLARARFIFVTVFWRSSRTLFCDISKLYSLKIIIKIGGWGGGGYAVSFCAVSTFLLHFVVFEICRASDGDDIKTVPAGQNTVIILRFACVVQIRQMNMCMQTCRYAVEFTAHLHTLSVHLLALCCLPNHASCADSHRQNSR